MQTNEQIIAIQEKYDLICTKYDYIMAFPELIFLRKLRRELIRLATGEILEVAAGTGRNFGFYQKSGKVTAIDLSPSMLEMARKRALKYQKDIRLYVMNAEAMNFNNQSFDTVISTLALCTFPNPVATLREMSRVCRKNGRILLLEHGRSMNERIGKWQDQVADSFARHVDCHMNRQPLDLVIQAGLKIMNQKSYYLGIVNVIEAKPIY